MSWTQEQCVKNNWVHPNFTSPLIWRELIDRGGKQVYLGGVDEFQEYTSHYYNVAPETTQLNETAIAAENLDVFQTLQLEVTQNRPPDPIRVCISHASSSTAYHLVSLILTQNVFQNDKIHLVLFDDSCHDNQLQALALELQDMACPNLSEVTVTDSPHEAFIAVSAVFLLNYNDLPLEGESQLSHAANIYTIYAGIIDYGASKNVRVVLVGPYANTGAALMARTVTSIKKEQFVASPAVAEHQACSILAAKINVASSDVKQVGIWGSCDSHMIPDTTHTLVHHFKGSIVGNDSFTLPLNKCLFDNNWLIQDFPNLLISRFLQSKSNLVEAASLVKLMKSWWKGDGTWHSVGVVFEGEQVALCRPCCCKRDVWEKIEGVEISEENRKGVEKQVERLQDELKQVIVRTSNERKMEEEEDENNYDKK